MMIIYMFRRLINTSARCGSNFEEKQYLDLITKIIKTGELQQGRNGNVYSTIGETDAIFFKR